ncbi:MAG TPA: hypothetical protein VJR04_08540, partial [Terriglobales bacterium]|nr:hypothetical protein [Terriglobales bacterium]
MLLFSVSKNMRVCAMAAVIFVSFFVVSPSLWSQQSSTAALTAYTTAVQISDPAKRLAAMELFLRSEPDSSLAQDALECATWDAIRLGDAARSARWASELLKRSPASPLGSPDRAVRTQQVPRRWGQRRRLEAVCCCHLDRHAQSDKEPWRRIRTR